MFCSLNDGLFGFFFFGLSQLVLLWFSSSCGSQVFVSSSMKQNDLGQPFGYLKASTALTCVNLFIMPYNYPVLLPLLGKTTPFNVPSNLSPSRMCVFTYSKPKSFLFILYCFNHAADLLEWCSVFMNKLSSTLCFSPSFRCTTNMLVCLEKRGEAADGWLTLFLSF